MFVALVVVAVTMNALFVGVMIQIRVTVPSVTIAVVTIMVGMWLVVIMASQ